MSLPSRVLTVLLLSAVTAPYADLPKGIAVSLSKSNVDSILQPGDFMFKYSESGSSTGKGMVGVFTKGIRVTEKAIKAGSKEWNELIDKEHLKFKKALEKGDPNAVHMGICVGKGKIAEANGTSLKDASVNHWDLFKDHKNEVWFVFRPKDRAFAGEVAKVASTWATGRTKYLVPAVVVVTNSSFGPKAKQKAMTYGQAFGVPGGPSSVSKMFCSEFGVAASQSAAIQMLSEQLKKKVTLDMLDQLPNQVKLDSYSSPVTVYGVFEHSGAFTQFGPMHVPV